MSKIDWPYEFPGVYWLDEKENNAITDVIKNGSLFRYYGLGTPKYVDSFEEKAKKLYGCNYALAVNSGTGALSTCMNAMDIGPGAEVIIPSFMWVATIGAVIHNNAIPVLCEVNESFTLDAEDLEKKITPKTKLIVAVHMAGCPCDMQAIMKIAKKHNIAVLEDCAQCNNGQYKGKKVGTFGDMGIFSLQLNKNMTCGEGGLIITDDEKLYYKAFSSHDMGLIRVNGRLAVPNDDLITWGQGRRMSELCGAIASVQIDKLKEITSDMRASKYRLKKLLNGIEEITFRKVYDEAGDTGPFLIFLLKNSEIAKNAVEKMKNEGLHNTFRIADYGLHIYYNIPSLVNKISLSCAGNPWDLQENKGSNYSYQKGSCPKSDKLFERSVILPIPAKLTENQLKDAANLISKAVSEDNVLNMI